MQKVFQGVALIAVVVAIIVVHNDTRAIRSNLNEEKSCIEAAKTAVDMQKCFDLMDSHRQP